MAKGPRVPSKQSSEAEPEKPGSVFVQTAMVNSPRAPSKQSSETEPEAPLSMSADEAAAYISKMAGELSGLARQAGLGHLAFLLEMAKLEAGNPSREPLPA